MFNLIEKITNQLNETCKSGRKIIILILIILSLICLLAILIGGANGKVYLNRFTFDEPISLILQRKNIKFTLSGYCIDEGCSNSNTKNGN